MASGDCRVLTTTVDKLMAQHVGFALVHESALMGWGIDNNVFLNHVDALLFDDTDFHKLGRDVPNKIGCFAESELDGIPVRLWSRASLGIRGGFDVTSCIRYGCEALAPELVLRKLPYSPDAPLLMEQRARLASILMVDDLDNEELELVADYVRGDLRRSSFSPPQS